MGIPLNPYEYANDCASLPAGKTPKQFKVRFYNIRKCSDNSLWSEVNVSVIVTQLAGDACFFEGEWKAGALTFRARLGINWNWGGGFLTGVTLIRSVPWFAWIFDNEIPPPNGPGVLASSHYSGMTIGICDATHIGYNGNVNWETA